MINKKTTVGLSLVVSFAALVYACRPETTITDNRSGTASQTGQSTGKAQDATSTGQNTNTTPTGGSTTTPTPAGTTPAAAPANYTMTWDVSTDAGITAYKVFVVPPDQNARFTGKTDVPIQVKNYPLASLQKNGNKYSVTVSSADVKTALGALVVNQTAYCFTIVAVNGVGNSSHSPVICP